MQLILIKVDQLVLRKCAMQVLLVFVEENALDPELLRGADVLCMFQQALAKDLPWRLKGPRVLEIIQAVSLSLFMDPFFCYPLCFQANSWPCFEDITKTVILFCGRLTATPMGLWTSKSSLQQLSIYTRWRSLTLKDGVYAAKLLSVNLIWMVMDISHQRNLEW